MVYKIIKKCPSAKKRKAKSKWIKVTKKYGIYNWITDAVHCANPHRLQFLEYYNCTWIAREEQQLFTKGVLPTKMEKNSFAVYVKQGRMCCGQSFHVELCSVGWGFMLLVSELHRKCSEMSSWKSNLIVQFRETRSFIWLSRTVHSSVHHSPSDCTREQKDSCCIVSYTYKSGIN